MYDCLAYQDGSCLACYLESFFTWKVCLMDDLSWQDLQVVVVVTDPDSFSHTTADCNRSSGSGHSITGFDRNTVDHTNSSNHNTNYYYHSTNYYHNTPIDHFHRSIRLDCIVDC